MLPARSEYVNYIVISTEWRPLLDIGLPQNKATTTGVINYFFLIIALILLLLLLLLY